MQDKHFCIAGIIFLQLIGTDCLDAAANLSGVKLTMNLIKIDYKINGKQSAFLRDPVVYLITG